MLLCHCTRAPARCRGAARGRTQIPFTTQGSADRDSPGSLSRQSNTTLNTARSLRAPSGTLPAFPLSPPCSPPSDRAAVPSTPPPRSRDADTERGQENALRRRKLRWRWISVRIRRRCGRDYFVECRDVMQHRRSCGARAVASLSGAIVGGCPEASGRRRPPSRP